MILLWRPFFFFFGNLKAQPFGLEAQAPITELTAFPIRFGSLSHSQRLKLLLDSCRLSVCDKLKYLLFRFEFRISIRFDDASLGFGTGQIQVCPLFLKNEKSNYDAVIRRQLVNALFPHSTSTALELPRVNWTVLPTSPVCWCPLWTVTL